MMECRRFAVGDWSLSSKLQEETRARRSSQGLRHCRNLNTGHQPFPTDGMFGLTAYMLLIFRRSTNPGLPHERIKIDVVKRTYEYIWHGSLAGLLREVCLDIVAVLPQ